MTLNDTWYTGFVLYKEDYGNNTVRLYFLSLEQGLVHLYCKGANSKSSKLGPALQYFSLLHLQVVGKKLNYINKVEIESLAILYPIEQFYCACYVNELLIKLLSTDCYMAEEAFELFNLYKDTILELFLANDHNQQSLTLRKFELSLLNFLGILPNISRDYLNDDIEVGKNYCLVSEQGFIDSKELEYMNLQYQEQEAQLRQQWEQNPDQVDPLAMQYLEFQHLQLQQQEKLTFTGKNLNLFKELFLVEANNYPTSNKLNSQTLEQVDLQSTSFNNKLFKVRVEVDQWQQVITRTSYKNESFTEEDLEKALANKLKEFEALQKSQTNDAFAQNFYNYKLFAQLDQNSQSLFLQQAANLSRTFLNVLLGNRVINAREKLIEYKKLLRDLEIA